VQESHDPLDVELMERTGGHHKRFGTLAHHGSEGNGPRWGLPGIGEPVVGMANREASLVITSTLLEPTNEPAGARSPSVRGPIHEVDHIAHTAESCMF
jgi:hypothetical protein